MTSGMIAWSCLAFLAGVLTGVGIAEDLDLSNVVTFFACVGLLVSFGAWMW